MVIGAASALLLAMPLTADASTSSHYYVSYGGGDYVTTGNVDWYNRSISIGGSVKAIAETCARMAVQAVSGSYRSPVYYRAVCSGTKTFGFNVGLDVPGGPQEVNISLSIAPSSSPNEWSVVNSDHCIRDSQYCN